MESDVARNVCAFTVVYFLIGCAPLREEYPMKP
jgi:hypothetical protein